MYIIYIGILYICAHCILTLSHIYVHIWYVDMDACRYSRMHTYECMLVCMYLLMQSACVHVCMDVCHLLCLRACMSCPTEDVLYPYFRTAGKLFVVCPAVSMDHFKRSSHLCLQRTNNTYQNLMKPPSNQEALNTQPCNNQPPMVIHD